jgi:Exportin-5 family
MDMHRRSSMLHNMSFNQNDFDEEKEYESFLAVEKTRLCDIIRSISRLHSSGMLTLGQQGAEALLKMSYDPTSVGKNQIGCTSLSPYFKAVESSCLFLLAIFHGLSKVTIEDNLAAQILGIINTLVQYPHEDPLCTTKILEVIVEGTLLLKGHSRLDCLSTVVSKVMSLVAFTSSRISSNCTLIQREIQANLRRKAASCLVKLGETFSTSFVPYFPTLFTQLQSILSESAIGLGERTSLIEFLLVIGQKIESEDERRQCLTFVVDPIMSLWQAEDIQRALASQNNFVLFLGSHLLFDSALDASRFEAAHSQRAKLSYMLNSSLAILKRLNVSSPYLEKFTLQFIQRTTHYIFQLLRFLEGMFNPSTWKVIPFYDDKTLLALLTLSLEEKKNLLGYGGFSREDAPNESFKEKLLIQLKIWLGNTRLALYQWLTEVCEKRENASVSSDSFILFYGALGEYWQHLFTPLFAGQYQLRFWKHFLQLVVSPLAFSCPTSLYSSHLSPWLALFIQQTTSMLNSLWRAFMTSDVKSSTKAAQKPDYEEDEASEQLIDELLHEKLLRSTTHSYAVLFLDIFFPLTERTQILAKVVTLPISPLLSFILSQEALLDAMLTSLLAFFTWRDSYTVEKAISICQRLILHLAGRPTFSPFFGQALVHATLRVLADGYHQELHETAIALLVSLFSTYRTDAEPIFMTLPISSTLSSFIHTFDTETDVKKKKALMRSFLKPILGLKHASLFALGADLTCIKSLPTRLILQQHARQQESGTFWDEHEDTRGLSELFQQQ